MSPIVVLALAGCAHRAVPDQSAVRDLDTVLSERRPERNRIEPYAWLQDRRPTGLAVTRDDRVFVAFPNWDDQHDYSVARVFPGGKLQPYPDRDWNSWNGDRASVGDKFVCVQSVWADGRGGLWILDAGAPRMDKIVRGAPKLVHVDLRSDRVDATYFLDDVATSRSYLNDVRVDFDRNVAYLTDSGAGALVVYDLGARRGRRVLVNDRSTAPEDITLRVGDHLLRDRETGGPLRMGADGIALDRDGKYLYWHALTGTSLYRIPTRILADRDRSAADLRDAVEFVARTPASDGLEIDEQGRVLHTAIELDSIVAYDPRKGTIDLVAHDRELHWPDSLALATDGRLFVTTSRIDQMPRFAGGVDRRTEPYGVLVLPPPAAVSAR